jgi:hypothetical protein
MTVSDLLEQPCNKSNNIKKLITVCSKLVDNLGQAVRTQFVDDLLADLLQDVRFLRVQVCKKVVTNLFTSCRQVVFALLVSRCCNKFGTNC